MDSGSYSSNGQYRPNINAPYPPQYGPPHVSAPYPPQYGPQINAQNPPQYGPPHISGPILLNMDHHIMVMVQVLQELEYK